MTNTPKSAVEAQPPAVREFLVLGDKMLIKQSAESTDGRYAVMEQLLNPGDGPPPHTHTREDEVFYIASGEFDILLGDRTIRAKAGDVLDAPRNVRHTYHCVGEAPGTIIFLTYPAGIERFFAEASKIAPSDMGKLFEVAAQYGLIFEKPEPSADKQKNK
ncbi:cupin domain-containing protein [Tunturibacter empetritectus]|uniref:Cupin domain-containing protein n=1 Tax=Tunturiibacter empetritectus TaxID=3069691 RepID=A0AAU7ZDB2_9BACT